MASDPSYSAYVRYAGMVGSPILSYEAWSRLRYELDKPEAIRKREKLLAAENKILQRTGPTVDSSRPHSGAASANLPSSPAPFSNPRREAIARIARQAEELGIYDTFVPPRS